MYLEYVKNRITFLCLPAHPKDHLDLGNLDIVQQSVDKPVGPRAPFIEFTMFVRKLQNKVHYKPKRYPVLAGKAVHKPVTGSQLP